MSGGRTKILALMVALALGAGGGMFLFLDPLGESERVGGPRGGAPRGGSGRPGKAPGKIQLPENPVAGASTGAVASATGGETSAGGTDSRGGSAGGGSASGRTTGGSGATAIDGGGSGGRGVSGGGSAGSGPGRRATPGGSSGGSSGGSGARSGAGKVARASGGRLASASGGGSRTGGSGDSDSATTTNSDEPYPEEGRTRVLRGYVYLSETREGVQGATLLWLDSPAGNGATIEARTGADGSFVLNLPETPIGMLRIGAGGLATRSFACPRTSSDGLVFELSAGARIEGKVTDKDGTAIASAEVSLRTSAGEERTGQTDSEGVFVFDRVPPRNTSILVRSGSLVGSGVLFVNRDQHRIDITCEPEVGLTIETVDPDGAPIPDSRVILTSGGRNLEQTTNGSGTTTFNGLSPGFWSVSIRAPSYAFYTGAMRIESGAVRTERIVLDRGLEITGRVTGPDGKPIAGATITLTLEPDAGRMLSGTFVTGRTDPAGEFRIKATLSSTGRRVRLKAEASGFRSQEITTVPPENRWVVQLEAGRVATIELIGADGQPVTSANGQIFGLHQNLPISDSGSRLTHAIHRPEDLVWPELRPGPWKIVISTDRGAWSGTLNVADRTPETGPIQLEPAAEIAATVIGATGVPTTGAIVQVCARDVQLACWRQSTTGNGAATVRGLPRGNFLVYTILPDGKQRRSELTLTPGQQATLTVDFSKSP